MCFLRCNNYCGFVQMFGIFEAVWFAGFYLAMESITFAILQSFSIGIASFFSFLYQIGVSHGLDSNSHAIISMVCATMFGEFMKICQVDSSYRVMIHQQQLKHPFIVGKVPSIIGYFLGILAFTELYVQYKSAHPSRYFETGTLDPFEFEPNYDPESLDPTTTWIFLLSLCYISYSIARESDWMKYRLKLSPLQRAQITGKCTTYIIFLILQLFLLSFYSVPIYLAALFCRTTNIGPNLTFVTLNLVGFVLGANVAQLETLHPFPRFPLLHPSYEFESHLSSRVQVLLLFLLPLISTAYYGSGKLFTSLTAGDKFYIFSLTTSMTLLQITKVLLNFRFINRFQHFRLIRRNREIQPNPIPIPNRDVEAQAGGGEVQNPAVVIAIVPKEGSSSENNNKENSEKTVEETEPDSNQNYNNNFSKDESKDNDEMKVVESKTASNIVISKSVITIEEFIKEIYSKPAEAIKKNEIETVEDEINENKLKLQKSDGTTNEIENAPSSKH